MYKINNPCFSFTASIVLNACLSDLFGVVLERLLRPRSKVILRYFSMCCRSMVCYLIVISVKLVFNVGLFFELSHYTWLDSIDCVIRIPTPLRNSLPGFGIFLLNSFCIRTRTMNLNVICQWQNSSILNLIFLYCSPTFTFTFL